MGTVFWGIIGILILAGIGRAIYDWFRKQPEPDWSDVYGHQDWVPHKSNGKMNSKPYTSPFKEEIRTDENGDQIIRFECPNPATADFGLIQEFLDHEFFMPKIEHYLGLAKEMNAPAAVIEAIEEKIRLDRELSQRIIDREMAELDAELERSSRNAESEYKIKRMLGSES